MGESANVKKESSLMPWVIGLSILGVLGIVSQDWYFEGNSGRDGACAQTASFMKPSEIPETEWPRLVGVLCLMRPVVNEEIQEGIDRFIETNGEDTAVLHDVAKFGGYTEILAEMIQNRYAEREEGLPEDLTAGLDEAEDELFAIGIEVPHSRQAFELIIPLPDAEACDPEGGESDENMSHE